MKFTEKQHRAIAHFFEKNPKYKPRLSIYPHVHYVYKSERFSVHINTLMKEWENDD